jgi:hypothetical protein
MPELCSSSGELDGDTSSYVEGDVAAGLS